MAAKKNCPVFPVLTLKFLIYSISIISALLSHHQTFTTTHLTTRAPSHPFPPPHHHQRLPLSLSHASSRVTFIAAFKCISRYNSMLSIFFYPLNECCMCCARVRRAFATFVSHIFDLMTTINTFTEYLRVHP